ncbi:MAG: FxLYD domain-containing protein [Methanomicrobiales archaeon]|nr:FxLYD domain-containing protein [Methanomicrobiales archaeon]
MKPLTLFLLLVFIVVIFSSGCLSDTPQKKLAAPPVTTTNPPIPITLPPSASIPGTPVQSPTLTPAVTVTSEEVLVSETENDAPNLRILKYHEERPEVGKLTITGIAKNDGKTIVPHVEVQIKFYDANKNVIISSKDTTDNFDPGETWGFTIAYPGPDSRKVKSYQVIITQV